jgi:inositol-phosphate phosphatase/L-galactose 1-phosphate phosphatase/histidinol-phosphatase
VIGLAPNSAAPPVPASEDSFVVPNPSPKELLEAALEISEAAAAIPMRYFRSGIAVEDKSDDSPVTIADRETEEQIRRAILERFPSHGILGEEFGRSDTAGEYTWVVDPIDGTRSFIAGLPLFGMLLGIMYGGVMQAGVIRMPALNECFAGARSGGATMNGMPIRCRPSPGLQRASIFINEANRLLTHHPERLKRLMGVGHLRRFSNDCYPFGLLAMGLIDVVVDCDLQPYDYLPIAPVVEAAGGVITDWKGRKLGLDSDGTVLAAGGPELHRALMDLLA